MQVVSALTEELDAMQLIMEELNYFRQPPGTLREAHGRGRYDSPARGDLPLRGKVHRQKALNIVDTLFNANDHHILSHTYRPIQTS